MTLLPVNALTAASEPERAFLARAFSIEQFAEGQSGWEQAWSRIAPQLGCLLDEFYDNILDSELGPLLAGANIARLKSQQQEYWHRVFCREPPLKREAQLSSIHLRHREIGLRGIDYIRAYFYFLIKFHRLVIRQSASLVEAEELISTVDAVIGQEISVALIRYYETVLIE